MKIGRKPCIKEARTSGRRMAAVACLLLTASCSKPFDVNVKAPEPIKVDVNMDVHVYQHGPPVAAAAKKSSASSANLAGDEADRYKAVLERRRNRMAEVQTLKNNSYVG